MDQILAQIGDTIGSVFSSPVLQFGIRAIGIYLVILWLASAYWAFRDMQQRSDNAILPYLAAAGIILFTPLFFVLAVWVYKIVRPHEKIGEVWERNLAEEALLAEVEAIHHCPTCERRIDDEWIICPTCRTRLNRVCPNCSRLVGLDWSLCAWCGKDFERRPIAAANLEPLPGVREPAGRIAAAIPDATPRPAPSAAAAVRTAAVRPSTVSRTSGSSRSTGSSRAAGGVSSAQDPLPER
jgi:RNA polymerase subunit RPABC4/transcription elongation factor Spt4